MEGNTLVEGQKVTNCHDWPLLSFVVPPYAISLAKMTSRSSNRQGTASTSGRFAVCAATRPLEDVLQNGKMERPLVGSAG